MAIHVNIGAAKTRLSELVAAAVRGEEVVLDRAGEPQVRLVPVDEIEAERRVELARKRKAAFGMYRHLVGDRDIPIMSLMTEEEQEESWRRKFGPPA